MNNPFLIYSILLSLLILILIYKAMQKKDDKEPEILRGNVEELKRGINKRSD